MPVAAMYPGTFDPITLGHEDLVKRAAELFDHVVVAIASNTGSKTPMFSVDERVEMAAAALADIENVRVARYEGLTVDFARDNDLRVIVRGLRAVSDFEYPSRPRASSKRPTSDLMPRRSKAISLCPSPTRSPSALRAFSARATGIIATYTTAA